MNTSFNPVRLFRTARLAAALGLALMPAMSLAQEAPAQRTEQVVVGQETTPTRIVLVEWRIKKGREDEFLKYWSEQATIADRSGLISEFLSRVEDQKQFPWMVWNLDPRWTTFVNVGFWRDGADFQQQIGRFINNAKPPLDFEAQKRRRVLVAPERWRVGGTPLVISDHPAVR
ncbi:MULTISPECIES: hypothetical protein [Microvirga]|uniref:hypothetical protein n=1 Tax=Microvirga TaxID=186650 RepID=UPI001CFE72B0|nr:hypothetical protein [Microvirga lenta]MCB5174664.1 hypothetical protein [Microvirga lenta]